MRIESTNRHGENATMRIFLSHASEDKKDFVRPLAEALKKYFDVWFDEYELCVGDSLLKKISDGLDSADYGVVVLSHAFFSKKWPQSELDGLFALESETRKIILPVWKDVSLDDVRKFSPIIAGRLAVNASEGVEKVVDEIRKAVEISNRAREIDLVDPAVRIGRRLDQTLKERAEALRLSRSEEGVALVTAAFDALFSTMESLLSKTGNRLEYLKFNTQYLPDQVPNPIFLVHASHHLSLSAELHSLGGNFTHEAELRALVYRRDSRSFSDEPEAGMMQQDEYRPAFVLPKQVVWIETTNKQPFTNPQLASQLLISLMSAVDRRSREA
jgi:hypothetical protein